MNITQKGIITLIKSAITGAKLPLPEGFSLEEAGELILSHSIQSICYHGAFLCGIPKTDPAMVTFFERYYRGLMKNELQAMTLEQVFCAFEKAGIDYLPLKGVIMKPCYPRPELRPMGDADVLIRVEQYEKIVPIMEALGFVPGEETDHELPWRKEELYLELHKRLIPSYNVDYHAYFGDGWQLGHKGEGFRYTMSDADAFIYQFAHFAKHYRDGGIGCRHVTDLWVYRRAKPDMDEQYIRGELEKLQLLEFYENMCRLLAVWFEDAPLDEKTEFISQFIFVSGNYGLLENRTMSEGIKTMKTARSTHWQRLKQIREAFFPGHAIIDKQYPVLKTHPWLLPVFWVIRIFDKALFQPETIKKRCRRLKVFTREKIDAHQQALKYVGLEYDF